MTRGTLIVDWALCRKLLLYFLSASCPVYFNSLYAGIQNSCLEKSPACILYAINMFKLTKKSSWHHFEKYFWQEIYFCKNCSAGDKQAEAKIRSHLCGTWSLLKPVYYFTKVLPHQYSSKHWVKKVSCSRRRLEFVFALLCFPWKSYFLNTVKSRDI